MAFTNISSFIDHAGENRKPPRIDGDRYSALAQLQQLQIYGQCWRIVDQEQLARVVPTTLACAICGDSGQVPYGNYLDQPGEATRPCANCKKVPI